MSIDPVSDMLTRIRNACLRKHKDVIFSHSKLKENIVKVIFDNGFIDDYRLEEDKKNFKNIVVDIKYSNSGIPVIRSIKRISKPGNRIKKSCSDIKPVLDNQGILIVSTSKGVISDEQCRKFSVGGEVICEIY